jgi:hypothetical protein
MDSYHTTGTSNPRHLPPHPVKSDPHNDQIDISQHQKIVTHHLDYDIHNNIWAIIS